MAKKPGPREAGKSDVDLGLKLRLLRNGRGMSQDELGKKLGVSFQQIQKYEKGTNRLPSARLQQIAAIFKVPLADFYPASNHTVGVESLLLHDDPVTVKMLRAYSRIQSLETRHSMVVFIESIADQYG